MSTKDFKTNKNKVITTVIIVISILFLIGIVISRAYNISNSDNASNNDLSIPDEEINLPISQGNINDIENSELKENSSNNSVSDDQSALRFQSVIDEKKENKEEVTYNNEDNYKAPRQIKSINNQQTKQDYYVEKETKVKETKEYNEEPKEKDVVVSKKSNPFGTVYNVSGSSGKKTQSASNSDLVKAVIHSDQTLGNGQSVIIRITEDMILKDDSKLPKNTILYGEVIYGQDRVTIKINRAMYTNKQSIAVNFEVYDNDYIRGIYYKTEIDKGVDRTKDETGGTIVSDIPIGNNSVLGKGAQVLERIVRGSVQNVNETVKSNRKLKLQEGYILYIKENKF